MPPAAATVGPIPVVLDRRYWFLALVPLGVLFLMYDVLDATQRDDVTFAIVAAAEFPNMAAAEARYRSFWVAAFLLAGAASTAVAASAALGLWRLPLARDRNAIATIILAIIALVILTETVGGRSAVRWYDSMGLAAIPPPAEAATAQPEIRPGAEADTPSADATPPADEPADSEEPTCREGPPPHCLYRTLFATPPEGADMDPALHLLDRGLDAIKILGAIALTLVGAGLVFTLARPRAPLPLDREAAQLAAAVARQHALLQQATIVYVLAIVAMLAWMHWPLPYLAGEATQDAYRELLLGNALVQGVGYSLGLASLYLPPALLLHRRIADLADASTTTPAASHDWLKAQGLATLPFDQLRQLGAMLLPTLLSLLPSLQTLWN
jgi:hypothetical protein